MLTIRRSLAAVLAAAFVIVGFVAAPATAAETRTISGTVTVPAGLSAEWKNRVSVGIQSTTGGGTVAVGGVNATTGAFSVSGLAPAVYMVTFSVSGYEDDNGVIQFSDVMTQVYANVDGTYAGYTPVDVTAGNKSGINASLSYGKTITGKVTVPTGTDANWYRGVYVSANAPGINSKSGYVNPNGTYVIRGVLPGTYTVGAHVRAYWPEGSSTSVTPLLIPEYWKEQRNNEDAVPVTVSTSGASGINFTLAKSFSMSGTVTLPSGSDTKQLAAVDVRVTDGGQVYAYGDVNPSTGAWTVKGLPPGSYTVEFQASSTYYDSATSTRKPSDIIGEFYNNATTASGATKVTISAANRTGINAQLAVGDSISGKVTLPGSAPTEWLYAISVTATSSTGTAFRGTVDRTTGEYRVGQLKPGTYTVQFSVGSYSLGGNPMVSPNLAPEYYNNSRTKAGATAVTLVAGTPRTGINATLELALATTTNPSIQWYNGKAGIKALPGTWSPPPTSISYQWLRDDVEIAGATNEIYMLKDSDRGKVFSVRVTAKLAGYVDTTKVARASIPLLAFTTTPAPTIAGTLRSGYTLTAKAGTWAPAATTLTYQWYRSGSAIKGATKSTYKLTTTDRGKKIAVKVTAKRTGYTSVALTSAAKTIYKEFSKTVTPKITGTLKSGKTLSVVRGTWSPTATYTYQWYRSGAKIAGATGKTYKLTSKDKGKLIKVRVTGKRTGYLTVTKTSAGRTVAK